MLTELIYLLRKRCYRVVATLSKKSELDQFDFRTTWCRPPPPPASVLSKKIQAKFVKKIKTSKRAQLFCIVVRSRAHGSALQGRKSRHRVLLTFTPLSLSLSLLPLSHFLSVPSHCHLPSSLYYESFTCPSS